MPETQFLAKNMFKLKIENPISQVQLNIECQNKLYKSVMRL